MFSIRDSCNQWVNRTFRQELESLNIENKELVETTISCFSELGILDNKINGYACEKLPKTEEGNIGIKVTYSTIFHNSLLEDNFSPVTYLLKIIQEYLKPNINKTKMNGAVARGLRTFTSLLREPDFASNLELHLKDFDSKVSTELNSKQDGKDHTDVLLNLTGIQYRIWLFQFSPRGLPHDIERVSGKRGELPSGIHILCPLHTELALNYDSSRKKVDKLVQKIEKYSEELNACSLKAIKRRENLELKINQNTLLLDSQKVLKEKDYIICNDELEIVNGWFFYSDKHVKRIANFIINNHNFDFDSYDNVKKILSTPEKYL